MTDAIETENQKAKLVTWAAVHVPGRGLLLLDPDTLDDGLERSGLSKSRVAPCFIVRGADREVEWVHLYSAVVGEDVEKTFREGGTVTVPLSFSIQGGALLIEHKDDGFVRAYGPGTWERVFRFNEKVFDVEENDAPDFE